MANDDVPVVHAPKFTISNISKYGGRHEINIRHTPNWSTAIDLTIEEMERLHEALHNFIAPYHDECEHWCGIPVCTMDCGDSDCTTCAVLL